MGSTLALLAPVALLCLAAVTVLLVFRTPPKSACSRCGFCQKRFFDGTLCESGHTPVFRPAEQVNTCTEFQPRNDDEDPQSRLS